MKKNKFLKVFSSAMALSIILAGCSTSSKSSKDGKPAVEFKTSVDNGGSAVSDSVLKVGILSADPLTGMFNPVFQPASDGQCSNGRYYGTHIRF